MPFQDGELEETYFKLHDLGFDGFSTDYPRMDRTRTVIARTRGFCRTDEGKADEDIPLKTRSHEL